MSSQDSNGNERLVNADVVRIVAMMMVIFLHTLWQFTLRPDFFATKLWWIVEPVIALSRTCVLLFFMLSGYLVIHKQRSIDENLQKIANKLILPLAFFSIFNLVSNFVKASRHNLTFFNYLSGELIRMTNEKSSPLWFLVVLIFLYLLNPVWKLLFDDLKKRKVARFVVLLALIYSLSAAVIEYLGMKQGVFFSGGTYWLGFVFFYLYGALMKQKWISFDNKYLNILLVAIGFIWNVGGDYLAMWLQSENLRFIFADYSANYLSLPVLMMAVGLFNLLMTANLNFLKSKLLIWLASVSFGVYLLHTFVILIFNDYTGITFDNLKLNPYLFILFYVPTVTITSMAITHFWKKIPVLKNLIGG